MMKGVKPNMSQYLTHNWCKRCHEWKEGKPFRCPDCSSRTRSNTHYVKTGL